MSEQNLQHSQCKVPFLLTRLFIFLGTFTSVTEQDQNNHFMSISFERDNFVIYTRLCGNHLLQLQMFLIGNISGLPQMRL